MDTPPFDHDKSLRDPLLSDEEFTSAAIRDYLRHGSPHDEAGAFRVWKQLKARTRGSAHRNIRAYGAIAACGLVSVMVYQSLTRESGRDKGPQTSLPIEMRLVKGADPTTFMLSVFTPQKCFSVLAGPTAAGVMTALTEPAETMPSQELLIRYKGRDALPRSDFSVGTKLCATCWNSDAAVSAENLQQAYEQAPETACVTL